MAHIISYKDNTEELSVPRMLINLVDPVVDAGDVAQAVHASVDSLDAVRIAHFDNDLLYDFRAQRPIVTYDNGKLAELAAPQMNIDVVTDMHGENFLYVSGQEPDFRWNALTADLLDVVNRFGVKEVFSFAGMPAGVPHTRPADVIIRSTTRADVQSVHGKADHFSQLQDFFEFHAGEQGVSVTNIRVRVPFYMARGPLPFISGALAVIKMTAQMGGPTLPLGDLEQLEDQQIRDVKVVIEEGSEFAELLAHLEDDYDKLPSNAGVMRPEQSLPSMPSAEEISQAAEQFLASLSSDPLKKAKIDDQVEALESEKCKDGSISDYQGLDYQSSGSHSSDSRHSSSQQKDNQGSIPGLRSMLSERLRRGKHHKDRGDISNADSGAKDNDSAQ